jgi:hypothetical protein
MLGSWRFGVGLLRLRGRIHMKYTFMLAFMGLGALAAPTFNSQSIIVNPVPTDLEVRTWVDRDPGGQGAPNYFVGDKITIYTQVNQDAYVYLFNINAGGQIDLVLPNAYGQSNYLRAGEIRQFPEAGARYQFDVAGPAGTDQVLAIASRQPLSLNQIADVRTGQARIKGASNLARALSIVVTPIPQDDWVSDAVSYRVQTYVAAVPTKPPVIVIAPSPEWVVAWENRSATGYSVSYKSVDLSLVFAYYQRMLQNSGWTQVQLNRGLAYSAQYQRGNDSLYLDLSRVRTTIEVNFRWK